VCGITGFVDFSGLDRDDARARVRRMADAIQHRGPDEEGYFVDDHAAFGHRRLAIIDLSSGQQPMSALNGAVQIIYNGEIYDFMAVRAELEAKGHRFRTRCDTEVLLIAYLEWGEACVDRLHGMFAFAIWDSRTRRLLLGRDRVGKKPLYFVRQGSVVAFASELKALRAGGLCPTELDPEALDCYFSFGYIPSPRTVYQGVRKLLPGHTLMVTANGETERRYWRIEFTKPDPALTFEAASEELGALLDQATRSRLESEVPLGAFLSGGIDSSLVVASMAKLVNRPVITNSIGADDGGATELPAARRVAEFLKTDHHEFMVKPDAMAVLEKIAWHFDEPLADSSAVPTWYVCQMARKTVTVALSGDGGDEAFGGYTFRYIPHVVESRVRAALPSIVRKPVFGGLGSLWPASAKLPRPLRLKTIFENLSVSDAEAYYRDLVWLRADARERLYSRKFQESLRGFTPYETVHPFYAGSDAPDALARSQLADMSIYMTDDVLAKVDRMSMAHSLEVRAPLMDTRVLEFAARMPAHFKMNMHEGKLLLRRLAAQRLPEEIHRLPKRGFSISAASWLRNEVRDFARDIIFNPASLLRDYLDTATTERMWSEHQSGARDHNVLLWGLMMFGLWERKHLTDVNAPGAGGSVSASSAPPVRADVVNG